MSVTNPSGGAGISIQQALGGQSAPSTATSLNKSTADTSSGWGTSSSATPQLESQTFDYNQPPQLSTGWQTNTAQPPAQNTTPPTQNPAAQTLNPGSQPKTLFGSDLFDQNFAHVNPLTGDVSQHNPAQYATLQGAQQLAQMLGGSIFGQQESPDYTGQTMNIRLADGSLANAGALMDLMNRGYSMDYIKNVYLPQQAQARYQGNFGEGSRGAPIQQYGSYQGSNSYTPPPTQPQQQQQGPAPGIQGQQPNAQGAYPAYQPQQGYIPGVTYGQSPVPYEFDPGMSAGFPGAGNIYGGFPGFGQTGQGYGSAYGPTGYQNGGFAGNNALMGLFGIPGFGGGGMNNMYGGFGNLGSIFDGGAGGGSLGGYSGLAQILNLLQGYGGGGGQNPAYSQAFMNRRPPLQGYGGMNSLFYPGYY